MPQDIAALRRQFARLDDAALDAFCLDPYPAVHDEFTRGLRKGEKITTSLPPNGSARARPISCVSWNACAPASCGARPCC